MIKIPKSEQLGINIPQKEQKDKKKSIFQAFTFVMFEINNFLANLINNLFIFKK